jgi:GeoRSP system SPASM domain protein
MLQVTHPGPGLGAGCGAVLEAFRGGPVAVSLTIPCALFDAATGAQLHNLGVREVLLAAESVDRFRAGRGAFSVTPSPVVGVSFPVTRHTWRELPALIALCREEGVRRLVLPMQRLYGGEPPFFITRAEQGELTAALASAGGVEGMNVTIHDPFLWRAFNPAVPFPQGGCQATNTMIAIAPDGGVYPCPSFPVRLGTVFETPLHEIIASPAKVDFRGRLRETPKGCVPCSELADCRGGCLGRAYAVHGSLDGADPACR